MNGGVAQADAKVLNGKKLEKPADPVKTVDGKEFAFIGWYKDSSFKEKYSFDQPVTKDITLYAYFVELLGTEEYTVTFSGYTGAEYPVKRREESCLICRSPEIRTERNSSAGGTARTTTKRS